MIIETKKIGDKKYILEEVLSRFDTKRNGRIYDWNWGRKYDRMMKIKSIFNENR